MTAISLWAADRLGEVSMVQLRALTALGEPATLGRLGDRLGITLPAAGRLADRLVAAGLVDRRAGGSRRGVVLRLTARGHALLADFDRAWLQEMHRRLAALPEQHRQALDGCLPAVEEAIRLLGDPQSEAAESGASITRLRSGG